MKQNPFTNPIEKAVKQARRGRECERSGGHNWEPMEPKDVQGSMFDVRCNRCGCWSNTATESSHQTV